MYPSRRRLSTLALLLLGLLAPSCSCGGGASIQLAPKFVLEGEGVGADPRGEAHYAIDFGTLTIGSELSPEVYLRNEGSASLSVQVEDASHIAKPFSLASGTFEIAPKTSRPLGLTFAPFREGSFDTVLTVTTNEKESTKRIRLLGRAVPSRLDCDTPRLDIGHVVVGESRSNTVTCTNKLEIPTTISLGDLVGVNTNFFSAEIQGVGDGKKADIPAGGAVDIQVEFRADNVLGPVEAILPLSDPSGEVVKIQVLATAVDWALQILVENDEGEKVPLSGCFTFPATDIEMEEIGTLWVRNVSRMPVRITGAALEEESEDFTYLGPFFDEPRSVAPDGEEEIELTLSFTPSTVAQHKASLVIQGSGERAAPMNGLRACIQGLGGGARIFCLPSTVDFGPVALGMAATRSYKCTNSAIVREGLPEPLLFVHGVESSAPERFQAEIRDWKKQGYSPGEEFWVEVTYRSEPDGPEGFDSAVITIENESPAKPRHETTVTAEARELPPCEFKISPQSIRFGVVAPGDQRTLTAHVVNQAEHDCILGKVRLAENSDPEFSMDLIEGALIPGRPTDAESESTDYRFPLSVTFAPSEVGSFSGAITFSISDPDDEIQEIPLSGIGEHPCLDIDPDPSQGIDFGAAPPGCAGRLVTISLSNRCTPDLRIDAVTITDAEDNLGAPQFVLDKLPRLPQVLKANDRWEFEVYFRPDGVGRMEGWIDIQASWNEEGEFVQAGPYALRIFGEGRHGATQTDSFTQSGMPKVDVLWVIDNSYSMISIQEHLQKKIPQFMHFAIEQKVDFHIGVTTTGLGGTDYTGCPGGFSGAEDGRLFPHPNLGRPRILTSSMGRDDLMENFAENVMVGTCHGAEYLFEAAKRALSHPWINTPLELGGNQGFLRPDASLSIIGLSDEPEQSTGTVASYVNFFRGLKPSRMKEDVKIHMISGGETGCPVAEQCQRCVQATKETGGVFLDLCTPLTDDEAWDEAFLEMSMGAFGFGSTFRLRGEPADQNGNGFIDRHDLEVRVDGREVPEFSGVRIWRYNPETNSIVFTPLHVPGAGQVVEVTYKVACIQHD